MLKKVWGSCERLDQRNLIQEVGPNNPKLEPAMQFDNQGGEGKGKGVCTMTKKKTSAR